MQANAYYDGATSCFRRSRGTNSVSTRRHARLYQRARERASEPADEREGGYLSIIYPLALALALDFALASDPSSLWILVVLFTEHG